MSSPLPDPANGEYCFRLWEIGICMNQLVDTLSRDPENLGDFGHAHEILRHSANLPNIDTKRVTK